MVYNTKSLAAYLDFASSLQCVPTKAVDGVVASSWPFMHECAYPSNSKSIVLLSAEVFLQPLHLFSSRGSRLYNNTQHVASLVLHKLLSLYFHHNYAAARQNTCQALIDYIRPQFVDLYFLVRCYTWQCGYYHYCVYQIFPSPKKSTSMIAEGSALFIRDCGRVPLNAVHVVRHTLIITPASS